MISRLIGSIVAAGAIALLLAGCTGGSGPEHISQFTIDYTLEATGTVHVVETIDYDFGGSDGRHGIDRFLASRFAVQPDQDRVYEYSNVKVSSPTGASDLFSTTLGNALQVRIGNAHATLSGPQRYIISYDIAGAVNSPGELSSPELTDGSSSNEFYWNATGHYWDPPIDRTTITVKSPATINGVVCYAGFEGAQDNCDSATSSGETATFSTGQLSSRQGVTIGVSWPAGTFPNTSPILQPRLPVNYTPVVTGSNDGPDPFWNPANWGTGLALLFGMPLAFRLLVIARRRDNKFLGVTPGSVPDNPAIAQVGPAPKDETIVVQYQPPAGLPVGAASTVLNKKRKNSDITATLVDLAVRGHLRIEEVEGGNKRKAKDYVLVATPDRAAQKQARSRPGGPDAAPLLPHESLLLGKLFAGGRHSVKLSSLTNKFASDMRAITTALDTWIQNQRYFLDKINAAHPLVTGGLFLGFLGFIVAMIMEGAWVFIPVGLGIGSFFTLGMASKAARRSALGHAVWVQLAGFRDYIATAEADRIRFDEGEDIFSRYMPWAMVFGEAERWAKVFAELVAQGKADPNPDWFVGNAGFHAGYLSGTVASLSSIGSAVDNFSSLATTSFTSTPGSSGGSSGGSGGGGSSGGGGGGGGGGSW
ncbi:MAG: DUF2207 domain-containing protein [Terrimesophilobacter sp.]